MVQNNITAIVIALGALLLVALGVIAYLFLRTRRIELECELLLRGSEGTNFVEIVNDNIDQVHGLMEEVNALSERYAAVLRRVAGAVQHVGVVRFDAFRDLGGLLSFAVALIDDRGNGLVFSSIYGRSESRTYAKPVIERSSPYELSPEEREAIRLAMQSKEMGALPVESRDRDHEERMANLRLFHDREYLQRPPERDAARLEAEERASGGRSPDRSERERLPEQRPVRRPQAAPKTERKPPAPKPSRRRGPGRENHVEAPERAGAAPGDRGRKDGTRSLDEEVQALLEQEEAPSPPGGRGRRSERAERPAPARQQKHPRPVSPRKTPAEPRPRGLDTPVDRLRDREND